jgi:hypothetical protein
MRTTVEILTLDKTQIGAKRTLLRRRSRRYSMLRGMTFFARA